jgi:hypothetical protein
MALGHRQGFPAPRSIGCQLFQPIVKTTVATVTPESADACAGTAASYVWPVRPWRPHGALSAEYFDDVKVIVSSDLV